MRGRTTEGGNALTGVRNGALARIISTSPGVTNLGTVPAGFTWILKTVHVLNSGGGPANGLIALSQSGGGVQAAFGTFDLQASASITLQGWTCLEPGDLLYLSADAAGLHIWAAGAELPGVRSS